jgi:hypothetical protein
MHTAARGCPSGMTSDCDDEIVPGIACLSVTTSPIRLVASARPEHLISLSRRRHDSDASHVTLAGEWQGKRPVHCYCYTGSR